MRGIIGLLGAAVGGYALVVRGALTLDLGSAAASARSDRSHRPRRSSP